MPFGMANRGPMAWRRRLRPTAWA